MVARLRNTIRTINLTISSTQVSLYNVFTAAGSPTDKVNINLTVNAGVILQAGMIGNGFVTGSVLYLTNAGTIAGTGGVGGGGVYIFASDAKFANMYNIGTNPGNGGDAIITNIAMVIDNTSGNIFGGGGGGTGGADSYGTYPITVIGTNYDYGLGFGGGGGGRGYNNAAGDSGSPGYRAAYGNDGFYQGVSGTAGSSSAPGNGGAGAFIISPSESGGQGGNGGDWGQAGQTGQPGTHSAGYTGPPPGSGGFAVKTNGAGITWVAGNNGTQVKGSTN